MKIDQLRAWVNDLQSGMYINCVYCGHRYGPNDQEVPADALRRHVASCEEHPMSKLVGECKRILGHVGSCDNQGRDPNVNFMVRVLSCAVEDAERVD